MNSASGNTFLMQHYSIHPSEALKPLL